MVQGRLLTTHPGGVYGGGEAPGGDPPLRQGAGKSSPGAPDLGSAVAAEQRRDREKGSVLEGFGTRVKYMPKGGVRGGLGGPGALAARPGGGRALWPPGALVAPLRLCFGCLVASGTLIFYIIFLDFFWHFS